MVPALSIVFIIMNMVIGIVLPIILCVTIMKVFGTPLKVFFIGAGTFVVFAMVLEQFCHVAVLASPIGDTVKNNPWAYAVYGGLAAGLFEETGRFITMKILLKKEQKVATTGFLFGAGHGGVEALIILLIGNINNLVYSLMINSGASEALLAVPDEAAKVTVQAGIDALIGTNSAMFLLAPIERILAMTGHIGFSVIVWMAVTRKKTILYPLAILLHMLLDTGSVVAKNLGVPTFGIEVVILIMVLAICYIAKQVYKPEEVVA